VIISPALSTRSGSFCAIERCDGDAALVSEAVDYWVDTVDQFCPWGARLSGETGVAQ